MEWLVLTVGVLISMYAFISMRKYKQTFSSGLTILDKKGKHLEELLQQSDTMVHELNHLSDYVADKVEQENTRLLNTLACVDEKTQVASKRVEELEVQLELHNEIILKASDLYTCLQSYDALLDQKHVEHSAEGAKTETPQITNYKHLEAIKMAKEGMDAREIAKALDIGQGEVKLLLGINKNLK